MVLSKLKPINTHGVGISIRNLCKLVKNKRKGLRLHHPGLHMEKIC